MQGILPYLQNFLSSATKTAPWWSNILSSLNKILSVVGATSSFFLVMSTRKNLVVILPTGIPSFLFRFCFVAASC
jgi:hypothetical protein